MFYSLSIGIDRLMEKRDASTTTRLWDHVKSPPCGFA
jgi:hypothetical protein